MSSVFHRPQRSSRKVTDSAAIFVHAGAGYHSVQNEAVHLQACNDAACAAMATLRSNGKAVEAVEMAIRVLEDREITNAGYGSNLAIDGIVEGDAVVVDHFGRSGAVGAVAQIKNPIALARHVLDLSTRELTLRRVPPNLLVGQGATDFAFDQGMSVLPHDALVSPAARDRWNRWKADLRSAERRAQKGQATVAKSRQQPPSAQLPPYEERPQSGGSAIPSQSVRNSVWNEGEPISPPSSAVGFRSPSADVSVRSRASSAAESQSPSSAIPGTPSSEAGDIVARPSNPLTADNLAASANRANLRHSTDAQDAARDPNSLTTQIEDDDDDDDDGDIDDTEEAFEQYGAGMYADGQRDVHDSGDTTMADDDSLQLPSLTPSPPNSSDGQAHDQDVITDTVGAIAIDNDGNIACGASSGGIGMKFRGRVGPAALVGVGAAVCPVNPEDKSRMCTGAVTSGTGEHMATTLAANVCAERLYNSVRSRRSGGLEPCTDDEAVKSMIEQDFMNHPSVQNSHSAGAIGVLAVKKMAHGVYLYFAHNTDSFALASMHADEAKPSCTMSRSHGNGMVAQGGRAIRYKRKW